MREFFFVHFDNWSLTTAFPTKGDIHLYEFGQIFVIQVLEEVGQYGLGAFDKATRSKTDINRDKSF
jgi:hypothetical protein